MNVGILLPSSNVYPAIGIEFMNGLRAFLKEKGIAGQVTFFSESAGLGGLEKEVYKLAEKLLVIDGVDILLAYVDERVLEMLRPLVYASGKLMIVINPGANHPVNWVPQPGIINLTLQHSFLCWLTGGIAANNNAAALAATTFYDCGYLHGASMVKSYVKHGGNIVFNDVTQQLYDDAFNVNDITAHLQTDKSLHSLLCVYDTKPAELLYKALGKYEDAKELQLFVSPMMLEQKALDSIPADAAFAVEGHLPWSRDMDNAENKSFTTIYKEQAKKEASIFSLLGWEAGMLLAHILVNEQGALTNGPELVEALKKVAFNSPRGVLKLDAETHFFIAPAGKFSRAANGKIQLEWIADHSVEWKMFTNEPTEGAVSGWTNTYLCY